MARKSRYDDNTRADIVSAYDAASDKRAVLSQYGITSQNIYQWRKQLVKGTIKRRVPTPARAAAKLAKKQQPVATFAFDTSEWAMKETKTANGHDAIHFRRALTGAVLDKVWDHELTQAEAKAIFDAANQLIDWVESASKAAP